MKTVTFECPEELFAELEDLIDSRPEFENQSQALRFALRRCVNGEQVDLPQDLIKRVEQVVESSHVYENRSQFMRAGARMLLEEESDEFGESR